MLIDAVISIQKWKEQPHSIEAYEGKDTLLTCKVYNKVEKHLLAEKSVDLKVLGWSMFLEEEQQTGVSLSW